MKNKRKNNKKSVKRVKKRSKKNKKNTRKKKTLFGGFGKKKCSKKYIKNKYQAVFIKKQIGGAKEQDNNNEKIKDLNPKCKSNIDDLQKEHRNYITEWIKFK